VEKREQEAHKEISEEEEMEESGKKQWNDIGTINYICLFLFE
jgi:hypothetical protein